MDVCCMDVCCMDVCYMDVCCMKVYVSGQSSMRRAPPSHRVVQRRFARIRGACTPVGSSNNTRTRIFNHGTTHQRTNLNLDDEGSGFIVMWAKV